jgi:hypothetical protein
LREPAKDYSSEQEARSALIRLGFAEDTINPLVSLLQEVEENVNLNFTPTIPSSAPTNRNPDSS